jgi:hypothetical protein
MKQRNYIVVPLLLLSALFYAYYLHQSQEPMLMYREQQQIFLWDADYIAGLLRQIGGLATLMSQFLVQYFLTPWHGALITASLITLSALFCWLTISRINKGICWAPLSWLPAFLQGVYLLEMGYHYDGIIALFMGSITIYVYAIIADRASWMMRTLMGCMLTVLIYIYLGSITVLFAICAFLYDLFQHHHKNYYSSIYLLLTLALASWLVTEGKIVGFDYALWVKGYCDYYVETGLWLSLAWILLPLVMVLAWLSNRFTLKPLLQISLCILIWLASAFFIYLQTEKHINQDLLTMATLMKCVNEEDWDGIINNKDLNYQNYLHLNYLNLALSHKGKLMTDLFKYPQKGAQSLMVNYQAYNDINVLFSHIYYHTGVVSEALCLSFGTMIATTYGNPSILKMLIKERLIYGDYQVAEKYITRLEKTYAYQEWATDMRMFLNNEDAINNDPELGKKRMNLPSPNPSFVVLDGVMADLVKVIETGTDETYALEYLMAMLMLDKNMPGIRYVADRFLQDWQGKPLPELIQQAVTVLAEHDVDYCRTHGVSEEMIDRFQIFRQTALEARRNNMNQQSALASYRGTFWYYYIFG